MADWPGCARQADLPSRLIFGDLDESSFKATAEGWQAAYRDGSGNGLELSVTGRQFSAKPTFLGGSGLSCGPVDPPRAFGQLLNLGAPQWHARLRERSRGALSDHTFMSMIAISRPCSISPTAGCVPSSSRLPPNACPGYLSGTCL